MTIQKIKTVYGSTAYAWAEDIEHAKATGRMVCMCEKDGHPKFVDGKRKRVPLDNLLTDASRKIVTYTLRFPDGTRRKGYWYADDMIEGVPSFMVPKAA